MVYHEFKVNILMKEETLLIWVEIENILLWGFAMNYDEK